VVVIGIIAILAALLLPALSKARNWEASTAEGALVVDMANAVVTADYPSCFHNGSGVFSFADGHLEPRKWKDARTKPARSSGTPLPHLLLCPRESGGLLVARQYHRLRGF